MDTPMIGDFLKKMVTGREPVSVTSGSTVGKKPAIRSLSGAFGGIQGTGSDRNDSFGGWIRTFDTRNSQNLSQIRRVSMLLSQENGYVNHSLLIYNRHVIGNKEPLADLGEEFRKKFGVKRAEKIEKMWQKAIRNAGTIFPSRSFCDADTQAFRSMIVTGDVFLHRKPAGMLDLYSGIDVGDVFTSGSPFGWLSSVAGADYHFDGLDFTDTGIPINYYLTPAFQVFSGGYRDRRKVPAANVMHIFDMARAEYGEVRGKPWIYPVLERVYQLVMIDKHNDKRVALLSRIFMIIQNQSHSPAEYGKSFMSLETGGASNTQDMDDTESDDATMRQAEEALQKNIMKFAEGAALIAPPGQEIKPFSIGGKDSAVMEYRTAIINEFAAGMGLTASMVRGVYDGNFAGERMGLIDLKMNFLRLQELWMRRFRIPVFSWWLENHAAEMMLSQEMVDYAVDMVEFPKPHIPWADPLKSVQESVAKIEAGLSSHQIEIEKMGESPKKVLADMILWDKMMTASGLAPKQSVEKDEEKEEKDEEKDGPVSDSSGNGS